ncbi:hypothetical protein ABW19_dt0205897 [Dactylella cylindrospora]|nr:hypothetical protein ABW19_dt0205897 [Dactylella cylindrospora]
MATAIYPKVKINTAKPLGGVVTNSAATNHVIPRPSPTPSKSAPSANNMSNTITVATPASASAGGAAGNVRSSERRRAVPNKFGSDTSIAGRIKRDKGVEIDEDGDIILGNQPPRKKLKPMPRGIPTVITTQYILDKYKDKPPSLTLHMHPTHFRFDQQDGTFNYNSAMRSILEYIAQETIPADAIEVFRDARIPFYEGRLIVHIHDHRTAAKDADGTSVKPKNDMLFSLNKYNEHLTPSPFVPFPAKQISDPIKEEPLTNGDAKPMDIDSASKASEENKKIFKTVLHPTPSTLHAEICLLAITPAIPPNARGRHNSVAQTPATPASAHPLTLSTANTKALPTILNDKTSLTFEADYLLATGPSLVLTPAESPEHAAAILDALAHPLHSRPVPPKKTRKRTVKEMAVDEAKAAEEERLMLIMDERHQPSSMGATDDGPVGNGGFDPSFNRWKALESIKKKHDEERIKKEQEKRAQQEKERAKAMAEQKVKQAQEAQAKAAGAEQSPQEMKRSFGEMIARGGAAQAHIHAAQAQAQVQAQAAAREQAQREAAAREAQREQAAREQQAVREQQAAREQAQREHAAQVAAAAQAAAQAQAAQAAQAAAAQAAAAAAAAQTPTSAPQQTTATQASPIAAASSPFTAHQGSPPMPSRTSNHSSQPGSRQQSPHMSTVQSIQHQHSQPIPGSPAMHASPMMRAGSQAMHGSPAMTQGSPLARGVPMMTAGQHQLNPAQIQQLMMQSAARNPNAMNIPKAAAQQLAGHNPEQQKIMLQRALLMRQQQQQAQQQQQMLAVAAAQAQHQQQQQQHGGQPGMMDGMAGHHPMGRAFVGNMGAGMQHLGGMVNIGMGMNGYQQMAMMQNGMPVAMPMGMNGPPTYTPAQINMLMAARGRGQPQPGQGQ